MPKNPSLPGADALFGKGGKKKPEPPKKPPAKKKASKPKAQKAKRVALEPRGSSTAKSAGEAKKPAPISSEVLSSSQNGNELQKYTFYIYPAIEEKLEEVWFKLRRKRKEKIPKWRIVNAILDAHLGDMDQIEELLDQV